MVIGTASRLDEALEMVKTTKFDIAVLDLKLGREMNYPVADLLIKLKKGFIFSTGFDEADMDGRYSQPVLEKPYDEARLVELIARAS